MKLAISTLGCPDWDFLRVLKEYSALGADIEVRGIDGEMEADRIARFSSERAEETKALLRENGLKPIEDVAPVIARLIANTASMKLYQKEIFDLIDKIEGAMK